MAYEMFRNAGVAYHFAFPVRVQQNGVFFSTSDMVEDGDDLFLERIGLDGDGALYKMYNRLTGPGSKKTRQYEGSSDISVLVSALDEVNGKDARRLYSYDNIDIPETINYLASLALAGSQDQGHKNYYMYRDSNGTGEWMPIVWDVGLSLGHDWGSQGYFDDDLNYNNTLQLGLTNRLKTMIWGSPELNAMFVRRVRTLMDTLLQPESTPLAERLMENRIDALADLIDPLGVTSDADLDFTKWGAWKDGGGSSTDASHRLRPQADRLKNEYLPGRRAFLYSSVPNSNGLPIPSAQQSFDQFDNPSSWGISDALNGAPGSNDSMYYVHFEGWRYEIFSKAERKNVLFGIAESDPDRDGRDNWSEYCYGTDPRKSDIVELGLLSSPSGGIDYLSLSFARRRQAFDIDWSLQSCDDLVNWLPETSTLLSGSLPQGSGLEKITLRSNSTYLDGGQKFFRVQGVKR